MAPAFRITAEFLDFCQAVRRDRVVSIGGFDEEYIGWGFEDNDFSERLDMSGVVRRWSPNVRVKHQWHESSVRAQDMWVRQQADLDRQRFESKFNVWGNTEANRGKDWGSLQ